MTFLTVLAIIQSNAGIHCPCPQVRLAKTPPRSLGLEASQDESPSTHGDGFEIRKITPKTFIIDPRGICEESGSYSYNRIPVGEKERNNA
jgi:hypothetical protein